MELEENTKSKTEEPKIEEENKVQFEEEVKQVEPQYIEITDKKNEPKSKEIDMGKLSEEPVKQINILKHITRNDVKSSYDLHNKLVTIPREVLNRRYAKLREVIFLFLEI